MGVQKWASGGDTGDLEGGARGLQGRAVKTGGEVTWGPGNRFGPHTHVTGEGLGLKEPGKRGKIGNTGWVGKEVRGKWDSFAKELGSLE